MNDNPSPGAIPIRAMPEPPPESSVHAQRDHWRTIAQAAWQRVAELEYVLKVKRLESEARARLVAESGGAAP